jgi:hypothetical protein
MSASNVEKLLFPSARLRLSVVILAPGETAEVKWIPMKWKISLSTLGVGVGLFAAFFGFKAWKSLRQPIPQLQFPKQEISDFPGSFYLRKVPPLNGQMDEVRMFVFRFSSLRS